MTLIKHLPETALEGDFIKFNLTQGEEEEELKEFDSASMQNNERRYLVKTKELNGRMEKEKESLCYWIELLDTQDLAKDSLFQGKNQAIAEKKIAIIDKAFTMHRRP